MVSPPSPVVGGVSIVGVIVRFQPVLQNYFLLGVPVLSVPHPSPQGHGSPCARNFGIGMDEGVNKVFPISGWVCTWLVHSRCFLVSVLSFSMEDSLEPKRVNSSRKGEEASPGTVWYYRQI